MGLHNYIRRPIRPKHEQSRWFYASAHCRQPRHCGRIAPLQVFESQHHRPLCGYDLQGFTEFPQHALLRRSRDLPV
jgi:hypothetical protein